MREDPLYRKLSDGDHVVAADRGGCGAWGFCG